MENCLSANPNINVVYAINEPAGEGAYNALKAAGQAEAGIAVYAIDGSCAGLKYVTSGEFAADAVQYPGKMASLGVDSIAKLARGGAKPSRDQRQVLLRHRHRAGGRQARRRPDHPVTRARPPPPAGAADLPEPGAARADYPAAPAARPYLPSTAPAPGKTPEGSP